MTLPEVPEELTSPNNVLYRRGRKAGKGGFAIVYEAQSNNEVVALKAVKSHGMPTKVADKLRTELQIHSRIRHRNIVAFSRAFSLQDNTYIVMELCSNGSLKQMIGDRGHLSLPEIRRFGMQICGALHYLHQKRIVHRDLKAANIFLDKNMAVKLGDFGLAALLIENEEDGQVQRRETVCGTPNYIAPEVLSKKRGHNTKADLWSLGVLFYHMLTGLMPFSKSTDKNNVAVFERVKTAVYDWPGGPDSSLPDTAKELVIKLLEKEEELRPSAAQVVSLPFFTTNPIPARLDPTCRTIQPTWLRIRDPKEMKVTGARIAYEAMLKECGLLVAESTDDASALYRSIVNELERNAGPQLPLKDVYGYRELKSDPHQNFVFKKPRPITNSMPVSSRQTITQEKTSIIGFGNESRKYGDQGGLDVSLLKDVLSNLLDRKAITRESVTSIIKKTQIQDSGMEDRLPPSVVYSCDSSDKWGFGFILSDGSIGVLSNKRPPLKMVLVRGALAHLLPHSQLRPSEGSHQTPEGLIPQDLECHFHELGQKVLPDGGIPIGSEVLELVESSNLYRDLLKNSGRIPAAVRVEDKRKCERGALMMLWTKFAKYMAARVPLNLLEANVLIHAYGQAAADQSSSPTPPFTDRLVLTQAIGNVRVWLWSSGGMQLDYPDNCRLSISSHGTIVRFIYWPVEQRPRGLATPLDQALFDSDNARIPISIGSGVKVDRHAAGTRPISAPPAPMKTVHNGSDQPASTDLASSDPITSSTPALNQPYCLHLANASPMTIPSKPCQNLLRTREFNINEFLGLDSHPGDFEIQEFLQTRNNANSGRDKLAFAYAVLFWWKDRSGIGKDRRPRIRYNITDAEKFMIRRHLDGKTERISRKDPGNSEEAVLLERYQESLRAEEARKAKFYQQENDGLAAGGKKRRARDIIVPVFDDEAVPEIIEVRPDRYETLGICPGLA